MGPARLFEPAAPGARSRLNCDLFVGHSRARASRNGWTMALVVIGFLSLLATFVQLWPYVSPKMIALVGGYGFRSNFFHLPLIFVMASVLRPEDVKRFGWWTLLLLVPMSMLMAAHPAPPRMRF